MIAAARLPERKLPANSQFLRLSKHSHNRNYRHRALVTQPQGDDREVDAGLEQVHGGRVPQRERGKPPAKLTLGDIDATLVLDFLSHLETERHNTARSRNARLATVRAFAHYVALQCPPALLHAQQLLAIPMKRFEKPLLGLLSRDEVQGILAAPDMTTWCGRRDRVMFALLFNTGARVSEMIGLRVADVALDATSSVCLQGKGHKQRTVPLWKETAVERAHAMACATVRRGARIRSPGRVASFARFADG